MQSKLNLKKLKALNLWKLAIKERDIEEERIKLRTYLENLMKENEILDNEKSMLEDVILSFFLILFRKPGIEILEQSLSLSVELQGQHSKTAKKQQNSKPTQAQGQTIQNSVKKTYSADYTTRRQQKTKSVF